MDGVACPGFIFTLLLLLCAQRSSGPAHQAPRPLNDYWPWCHALQRPPPLRCVCSTGRHGSSASGKWTSMLGIRLHASPTPLCLEIERHAWLGANTAATVVVPTTISTTGSLGHATFISYYALMCCRYVYCTVHMEVHTCMYMFEHAHQHGRPRYGDIYLLAFVLGWCNTL